MNDGLFYVLNHRDEMLLSTGDLHLALIVLKRLRDEARVVRHDGTMLAYMAGERAGATGRMLAERKWIPPVIRL